MGFKSFVTEVYQSVDLKVPFSCTWKMKEHLIDEYLIFTDNSEIYI
jgi:hypothetical protein